MKTENLKDRIITYGAIIASIILLLSLMRNINQARGVRGEIEKKRAEVEKLEKETLEIQNRIDQEQTPEFVEKEIRNRLGLVKENEVVVVLPDEDVLRSLSPKIPEDLEILPDPNWKKWLKLFI